MNPAYLRPLSFGEILDGAFSVYRRNFVPLFVTTILPLLPTMGVGGVFSRSVALEQAAGNQPSFNFTFILVLLVGLVVSIAMWAALTHEVGQGWMGGEVSVGDGYRTGFRRFLPLVGAAILAYLVFAGAMIVVWLAAAMVGGIIAALAVGLGSGALGLIAIPLAIGMVLLMIAGGALFFAVLPAVVIERKGPVEAIRRSVTLARGAIPRVVGILVVSGLIVMLPALGVMLLTGGFAALANPGTIPSAGQFWVQQVGASVVGALTTPFLVAALVILYFDRRVRTEALDVQFATDALPTF